MRNFKKFLALVLAMLMVSACAVSVSAFTDQAAVDASDYKVAIELLADLGVVKGDENGVFNPEGTLLREQAAVIAAKLLAGANAPEWADTTTAFVDVEDQWSFAYINYAAKYKAMEGIGANTFEPKRELDIDEAVKIALAVADPNALRQATINMNANPTGYWADHFIMAAGAVGTGENGAAKGSLFEGLPVIRNYEVPCTRGMFAQLMANAFKYGNGIMESFGYKAMKATVAVDANAKTVTMTEVLPKNAPANTKAVVITVTEDLFAAALKAEGYDKITAADLVNGSFINVVCLEATKEIASLEVLTEIKTLKYDAEKIKVVKKADDSLNTALIEIDGIQYTVGAPDDKGSTDVWGGTATAVRGIELKVVNFKNQTSTINANGMTATTIPDFYEAFLYNDDGDDDYERAIIKEYKLVTFNKSETKVDHDDKTETADVNVTTIKYFQADGSAASKVYPRDDRYLTVAGAGYTAWGETPLLANFTIVDAKNITANILEKADTLTGVVGEIAPGKSIEIIGETSETISYAKGYVTPADWVYSQKVTIYTIGGKYVSVASASTGVESGMVNKTILIDNVTIADGVAMIEGYEYANGTLTALAQPLKVVGADVVGKLLPKYAFNQAAGAVDYNNDKDTAESDAADNACTLVYLADKKADGKPTGTEYLLEDQKFYNFKVTAEGAYFAGASEKAIPTTGFANSNKEVKIADGYLRVNDVATFKMEGTYVVVTNKEVEDEKAYTAYTENTLTVTANGTIPANNYITYIARDKNLNGFTDTINNKVAFVFVDEINEKNPDAKKYMTLAESGVKTIVQVYEKVSAALDYTKYNAIDIFTGEVVSVIAKPGYDVDLTAAGVKYASINEAGEIISNNPVWLADFNVTVVKELGVVTSISTLNKYLQSDYNTTKKDFDAATLRTAEDKLENKISVNTDSLTVWKLKDGKLTKDTEFEFTVNTTAYGFVNNGTIIVLPH